jgi:tetratricopeptide (TPR) repeat protein
MRISPSQTKALCFLVCLLSFLTSFSQRDYKKEIDSLSLLAQQRSGVQKAEVLSKISVIYLDYLEDTESSLRFTKQAIALAQKENGGLLLADCYCTLGRIKMDQGQPDSAIYFFSRSLNAIGKNPATQSITYSNFESCRLAAQVFANFGNAYRKKLNLSRSADHYLKALRAYEIADDSVKLRFVSHVNSHGEKINKEQATVKWALDYLKRHPDDKEAAKICEEGSRALSGIRWTLIDLGGLFEKTKDYSQALTYMKKAEKNAEEVQAKGSHLKILMSIGDIYAKKNDPDSAILYYYKLRTASLRQSNLMYYIQANRSLGDIFSLKKETEKALSFLRQTDSILEPVRNGKYSGNVMYSDINSANGEAVLISMSAFNSELIGDIYAKAGDPEKAKAFYLKGISEFQTAAQNEFIPGIAKNDIGFFLNYKLGEMYSKSGLHDKGLSLLMKAVPQIESSHNTEGKMNVYKAIYEAADRKADIRLSYIYYKKFIHLRDSLFGRQNANEMADLQKRFEVEKKDADIELLNKARETQEAEIEKQKLVRNGFIIGSVIFLILAIIIFRSLQQNRKAKKIIEEQKSEVEHKNKEITDSIRYARRIQSAMMPTKDYLEKSVSRLQKK